MRITVPWLRERSPRGAGRHRSHCLELRGCSEGPCHRDLVWGELGKFCGHSMSLITRRQQKQVSALQECCPWRVKNGLLSAASYMLWKIQLYLGIPQLFCGQNSSSFQVWVATPNSGPVSELFINASFISPAPCECLVILEVRKSKSYVEVLYVEVLPGPQYRGLPFISSCSECNSSLGKCWDTNSCPFVQPHLIVNWIKFNGGDNYFFHSLYSYF